MNKSNFPISLLAALIIVGCTQIPAYEKPQPPIASTFPRSAPAGSANVPVATISWQTYFGDEKLRALISTALANNRDLILAMRRVEETRARYGIQQANRRPNISGSASVTRLGMPAGVLPIQRDGASNQLLLNQFQAGLIASAWELDFWGRLRSLEIAALETYLATDEARHAVQVTVIAQVSSSYLIERELDERIDLAERTIKTRQQSARIARRRFEVGSAARVDAIQAEILLSQAQAELAVLQRLREQNRNALEFLAGSSLPAEHRSLSSIEAVFVHSIDAGLPSDMLIQRPDLRAAERRLKAANANIGAARAAFFPRITLTGSLGLASTELDGLFSGNSRNWNFMPSITLPLFDGGRNRAGLDLARAQYNSAITEYERSVQNAFREVADVLAERHWLTEQIQAQRTSLEAQRERSRIVALRYQQGATTYLEVLDAERELFAVEQALVQTRRAYLASSINLYSVLGGGGSNNE
ncbi:Outer membrane protein OprM [Candidatus Nitrotoga sp. BS]|uniref:efflux transporter outer membrane subunit n=1 Tax=Candidatus Nitrotoga sp. BS TaxID=2890408 RepID=UPI001EF1EF13|nr:efflux transporter outer membrane subunit [Candidatus Nitrotoga sp. BS]CAH1199033.1 Outer membrane protein OprM [Candidatus Nitrotoga sp. BS]